MIGWAMAGKTHAAEGEVVGITAGKVEVFAVKLKLAVLNRDEAGRARLAGLVRKGEGAAGQKAEGKERLGVENHLGDL